MRYLPNVVLLALMFFASTGAAQVPIGETIFIIRDCSTEVTTDCTEEDVEFEAPFVTVNNSGSILVVWQQLMGGPGSIHGRLFDSLGSAQTSYFDIAAIDGVNQSSPSATALSDGTFVVVWESGFEIALGRFDETGVLLPTPEPLVSCEGYHENRKPKVASFSEGFAVVWEGRVGPNYDVLVRQFDNNGHPLDSNCSCVNSPVAVCEDSDSSTGETDPAIVGAPGRFVVSWTKFIMNPNYDILWRVYDGDTPQPGSIQRMASDEYERESDVAHGKDKFIVVWEDGRRFSHTEPPEIESRVLDSLGVPPSESEVVRINVTTSERQVSPEIAIDKCDTSAVTWMHRVSGATDDFRIRFRMFNRDGETSHSADCDPDSPGICTIKDTVNKERSPSVEEVIPGRFVIAWEDSSADAIKMRLVEMDVDADGLPDLDDEARLDEDLDGIPDGCDDCFGDNYAGNSDGDEFCNDRDACIDEDGDGFGTGELQEICPVDNCPMVPNDDQADSDEDGVGDACEEPALALILLDESASMSSLFDEATSKCEKSAEQFAVDLEMFFDRNPVLTDSQANVTAFRSQGFSVTILEPLLVDDGFGSSSDFSAILESYEPMCAGQTPLAESICHGALLLKDKQESLGGTCVNPTSGVGAGLQGTNANCILVVNTDGGENASLGECGGSETVTTDPPFDPGSWQNRVWEVVNESNVRLLVRFWDDSPFTPALPKEAESLKKIGDKTLTDRDFLRKLSLETGGAFQEVENDTEFIPPIIGDDALYLHDGRFRVEGTWSSSQISGTSRALGATSNSSGVLWIFEKDNWEILVKVVDGCMRNGHYWLFFSGATSLDHTITITDMAVSSEKTYVGGQSATIDLEAFPCQ